MYGAVIGSSIAVDNFDKVKKNGIYFLTEGQLDGPLPAHVDRLYTSSHNAWLLTKLFAVDSEKIVSLPINEKFLIQDSVKKLDFYVTLLDAKQKPGAVMFMFEGKEIGNVFYAGKCCYGEDFFCRRLCNFLKSKAVDYLYVHDACEDCHSHSRTKSVAVEEVVNTIRWNSNCKVVICEPCFREDILVELKSRLNAQVSVSENVMKHLKEVGQASGFTLDQLKAQVIITDRKPIKKRIGGQQVINIFLIPCSMKRSSEEIQEKISKLRKKGYHAIFYRNHCSPLELMELVMAINAKHTVTIRPPPKVRKKDIDFWYHLGDGEKFLSGLDNSKSHMTLEPSEGIGSCISDTEILRSIFCKIAEDEDDAFETNKWDSDAPSEALTPEELIMIDSDSSYTPTIIAVKPAAKV